MRIVFFGTPDWSVPSLEALAESDHDLSLIVTQAPKRREREGAPTPSPVAVASTRRGITFIEAESVRAADFRSRIVSEAPDLLVVVAFGRIFPPWLLELPRLGAVNLHFSLLPRYRGAAPVQWAIADGDAETGVTTMKMVEELDAGPIYLQERLRIEPEERAPHLGRRLAEKGAALLLMTVDGIEKGTLLPREQNPRDASHARLLRTEDGWIDWSSPAEKIARRVRAFDPWPGQSALSRKGRIRFLDAHPHAGPTVPESEPGTVLDEDGRSVRIACGGGSMLEASQVRPEGRRAMTGSEAVRGRHLIVGERLSGPSPA